MTRRRPKKDIGGTVGAKVRIGDGLTCKCVVFYGMFSHGGRYEVEGVGTDSDNAAHSLQEARFYELRRWRRARSLWHGAAQ